MMEIHLDPLGGIAGDMFVAALLDLRPDQEEGLRQTLALCPLLEGVDFLSSAHNDGILSGRQFLVSRRRESGHTAPPHGHEEHSHHGHHDGHVHAPHHHHHGDEQAGAHHGHTRWSTIREALTSSDLDRDTIAHALGIFSRLADAEAAVHGVEPDDVSFHEVGAWDSIADIVAASWLITRLGVTRWTIGPLPLGSGRVDTSHGPLPVPAPATARLLEGFATIDDGIGGERVTPTGAAIISYLCSTTTAPSAPRTIVGSGHGFGTRRLPGISNCLRALAFGVAEHAPAVQDQVTVLECEIDDQTGEDLAQAIDALRATKGVLDIVQASVFGKKGRMMTHLRILAEPHARDAVLGAIFNETTTIGIRHSLVQRSVLQRENRTVELEGRTLRVKTVGRPSGTTAKVEADDLSDIAGSGPREALRRQASEIIRKDRKGD